MLTGCYHASSERIGRGDTWKCMYCGDRFVSDTVVEVLQKQVTLLQSLLLSAQNNEAHLASKLSDRTLRRYKKELGFLPSPAVTSTVRAIKAVRACYYTRRWWARRFGISEPTLRKLCRLAAKEGRVSSVDSVSYEEYDQVISTEYLPRVSLRLQRAGRKNRRIAGKIDLPEPLTKE